MQVHTTVTVTIFTHYLRNINCTSCKITALANLRDSTVSVPGHHYKMNTAIKPHEFFGFPVHIRVTFTLYCSPLSMQ